MLQMRVATVWMAAEGRPETRTCGGVGGGVLSNVDCIKVYFK